jgi:hypothetical protein
LLAIQVVASGDKAESQIAHAESGGDPTHLLKAIRFISLIGIFVIVAVWFEFTAWAIREAIPDSD